jgi:rRNA maturation endonuclease Nob1
MNLNQLREQFPNEATCRRFFENIRWPSGRICPHCGHDKSWVIQAATNRQKRYECSH